MKPLNYSKYKNRNKVESGSILIAQPFMVSEIFQRGVILILENDIAGSTGILLNKKSNLSISNVLPNLHTANPLYFGGNFDVKILSYIHSDSEIPDSILLGENLFWGGNYDVLSEKINSNSFNLHEINFFAGYIQWSAGQLEEEINDNKWWVSEINPKELFTVPADDFWAISLENYGHLYSLFGDIPDPSIN